MIKRNLISKALVAILLAFTLCSCGKLDDIKVTSCSLASISPKGLRAADAVLAISLDNPSGLAVRVSDLEGVIVRNGQTAATFSAGELFMEKKTHQMYNLDCSAALDQSVSIKELIALATKRDFTGYTIDLSVKVSTKKGVGKTLKFKNLEISELLQ